MRLAARRPDRRVAGGAASWPAAPLKLTRVRADWQMETADLTFPLVGSIFFIGTPREMV
jgi:hypothetical protein